MLIRTFAAAAAGLGLALAPIIPASAAPGGNRAPVEASGTFDISDMCPGLTVHVEAHVVGASTTVAKSDGTSLVRTHLVEDDVYSVGANSASGTYTFNIQVILDADGNPIQGSQTGTIVSITLPDGTVFHSGGRLKDIVNAQTDYFFAPTNGVFKNFDALCAYLGS